MTQAVFESSFDRRVRTACTFVQAGQHFVQCGGPGAISTFLGSCVAACIRDKELGIGGLNHFLLPFGPDDGDRSARYSVNAMELLINQILSFGASRCDLEAKIFGGASVLATSSSNPVGEQNGRFVKEFLKEEKIPILAKDLGGTRARRVYFFPNTGRASILHVASSESIDVEKTAAEYQNKLMGSVNSGYIELF